MPTSQGTLCVLPNPYAALDAKGRPAAAFPLEGLSGRDRYLGAQIDEARTKKIQRVVFHPAGYVHEKGAGDAELVAAWAALEPLTVADTAYYRMALRRGDDVLPGDEETARKVGLPDGTPVGREALAVAAAKAEAKFRARYGVAPAIAQSTATEAKETAS